MHTRHNLPLALAALTTVVFPSLNWAANEIGFIEKFALSQDRAKVLGELVPGSEDYYYFHALHFQNTRDEAKLADILAQWRKRFPDENARRRVIENREALLDYDTEPRKTLDYLKQRLGVRHDHQQEVRDRKPDLPAVLDPARIARDVFEKSALANNGDLSQLTNEALESLVARKVPLTAQQRRAVLGRLTRPDVPGLLDLIITDLRTPESAGFGEFAIHRALLPGQMDELLKTFPNFLSQQAFVFARMRKLAPSADVDIVSDAAEREAWLDRVQAFAKQLPQSHNTLKSRVLHLRLDHDRRKGVYDRALFLEYLRLPRQLGYVNPRWISQMAGTRQTMCDLNAVLDEPLVSAPPVGNDEALVREYFLHIFAQEPAATAEAALAPWTEFIRDTWLRPVLAESMIVNGIGSAESWASLLTPQAFQALKDRVDIEFPRTNAELFAPADAVKFDVVVKNAPKLIVKTYELNALNFFLAQKRQLNTDVNLDGLVANSEETHTFDNGPFRRERRAFQFPALAGKRGAWIIEFIGGGRSSRVLLRKGQWQVVQQTGPGGDMLTVLDEAGAPVKDAAAWLDGRRLAPDEKTARIVVPFTQQPGRRPIVVSDATGGFATLTQFDHHAEEYKLDAGFFLEREQLLSRRKATIAIRTALLVGESHLDPRLLLDPLLTITSTSLDGIKTTAEVKALKLSAGSVFTHTFEVPDRTARIDAKLTAQVEVLSAGGEKRTLTADRWWAINGTAKQDVTYDGQFAKFGDDYVYELLGRNGEPVADQQVMFTFVQGGFGNPETVALRTDAKGRIALGVLPEIRQLSAEAPNGRRTTFAPADFERTWPGSLHARTGEAIRIPTPVKLVNLAGSPSPVSLIEMRAGTIIADHTAKVRLDAGFLVIEGLAPGDYSLRLRGDGRDIEIKVSGGKASQGWLLGKARNLEATPVGELHLTDLRADAEFVSVRLANVSPFTRVHVAATRFVPKWTLQEFLGGMTRFGPGEGAPARLRNLYSAGREIGDEYRYILDRRHAKIFPGNMLTRPGLLLNPWERRDTDMQDLTVKTGEEFGMTGGDKEAQLRRAKQESRPEMTSVKMSHHIEPDLDFLAEPSTVLFNLLPDADGVVKISRKALGDRQHVQFYAEDLRNAVSRSIALPEAGTKFTDVRLARNLDPARPFSQKKEITVLQQGATLTLEDIRTSEIETYDTLAGVHLLFTTLSHDANLAKFAWVLQWPKLKDDEKRAKYSEFACHELGFFLSRKDPAFFEKVVKPYLANKKDRTFMDDWLLGNDLRPYLEPWAFARLNAAERALLAQRQPAEAAGIARSLREAWEMIPPDRAKYEVFFDSGLGGRAMDVDGETRSLGRMLRTDATADTPVADAVPAPALPKAKMAKGRDGANRDGTAFKESAKQEQQTAVGGGLSVDALGDLQAEKKLGQRDMSAAEKDAVDRFEERNKMLKSSSGALGLGAVQDGKGNEFAYFGVDFAKAERGAVRAYYRALGATKEWAENNYYRLPIAEQDADLVPVNAFWRDFAAHVAAGGKGPFVSPHIAEAAHNFTGMMLALAVLDLPFDAPQHTTKSDASRFTITAGGPMVVFHKEIKPSAAAQPGGAQLLVSQSFFRHGDRFRMEGNEKFEKYVTGEFLTGVVYGANAVVTNPTSAPVKAEVLLQIPRGAVPVLGSKATDSRHVRLEPYTTKTFEYHFYFPSVAEGGAKFPHFPVNVAVANTAAASATAFEFNVVGRLTEVDKASWDYVSQYGTVEEVFTFLEQHNLAALAPDRVAWRCKDAAFFKRFTAFLAAHHVWDETIYSYALLHNDATALREWLRHKDPFVSQCGPWLSTRLILLDPIERRAYEHLEYSPLVNQRAHRLGAEHRIANPALLSQYRSLLDVLAHKPQADAMDTLSVTYYLFLQDRVEEALQRFHSVDPEAMLKEVQHDNFGPGNAGFITIAKPAVPTRIQHDYLRCYADFYEGNLAEARGIASRYADHPVTRWRTLFADVTTQLDEIEGKAVKAAPADGPDRERQQSELAATDPAFDFKIEDRAIALTWRNLREVTIHYYPMDPEFSFSSSPFVSQDAGRFSIVKPARTVRHELPPGKDATRIELPAEFAKANVLIEVTGAGLRRTQAFHANTLKLAVAENYGRIEALDSATGKAVGKAYVKVYARLKNGAVRFFKDGYTDLRGRFDYASLNGSATAQPPRPPEPLPANGLDWQMLKSSELGEVEKLAILILSESHGATTREVNPPRE